MRLDTADVRQVIFHCSLMYAIFHDVKAKEDGTSVICHRCYGTADEVA
jgi:hypothetical protein